jgi:hypothetical protein
MKKERLKLLRALADGAEEGLEKAIASVSGYAGPEEMRAALAKTLFQEPEVRQALHELYHKAKESYGNSAKPRAIDKRKMTGRVQAPRHDSPKGKK